MTASLKREASAVMASDFAERLMVRLAPEALQISMNLLSMSGRKSNSRKRLRRDPGASAGCQHSFAQGSVVQGGGPHLLERFQACFRPAHPSSGSDW